MGIALKTHAIMQGYKQVIWSSSCFLPAKPDYCKRIQTVPHNWQKRVTVTTTAPLYFRRPTRPCLAYWFIAPVTLRWFYQRRQFFTG